MSECKCDFRTYMVGDGCEVCNPAKSLEYAKETISEQEAEIERLNAALRYEQHLAERVGTHGPGCETWGPAHYECAVRALSAMTTQRDRLREALETAREVIRVDRNSAFESSQIGGVIPDTGDAEWVAEYDLIIARINLVLDVAGTHE